MHIVYIAMARNKFIQNQRDKVTYIIVVLYELKLELATGYIATANHTDSELSDA